MGWGKNPIYTGKEPQQNKIILIVRFRFGGISFKLFTTPNWYDLTACSSGMIIAIICRACIAWTLGVMITRL